MNIKKLLPFLFTVMAVAFANNVSAQTAISYQAKGDVNAATQDYKSAIINYNLAIKKSDKKDKIQLATLYYSVGLSQQKLSLDNDAIKSYTKAIELNPKLRGAYWDRGVVYEKLNKPQNAVNDYNAAIANTNTNDGDTGTELLYTNVAFNELKLGNFDKALQADSMAIATNPNYTRAYVSRADVYGAQQNYKLADSNYTLALGSIDNNAAAIGDSVAKQWASFIYTSRADTKLNRKLYKDAINDYSFALLLNPNYKIAYWNRGAAYHLNGDYSLAVDNYTKAINYYKDDNESLSKLYENKALNELGLNLFDKALQDDSLAIAYDPKNDAALFYQGTAYTQSGNYAAGIASYRKMLEFSKDDKKRQAFIYYQIANNEYFLNQFDKVVADCTKAIALDPDNGDAYFYRAKVYLKKLNSKQLAMDDFNKVIALDTTKKSVSYIFSLLYVGKEDEAIGILQNDLLTADSQTLIGDYYNLACLYAITNKADEANVYLKKAIDSGYAKKYAAADEDLENIRNTDDYKSTMAGAGN